MKVKIGLMIIMCAILSCSAKKPESVAPKQVTTVNPARQTISKTVLFTGSIEAEDFADVYPRGPGKVSKKLLSEGDAVKKGQPIMYTERDEVGFTFKPAPVVSPMAGFIGRIMADVGAAVSPSSPVATVVATDKMRIKLDVPERYLPVLKNGTDASLSVGSLPDKSFQGEITSISKTVDPKTRAGRVEIIIPNDEHLILHGMFAKVYLPVETHEDALVIPETCIMWEGDKQSVYAAEAGKVAKKYIKVGIKNDGDIEVLEGLKGDEKIISENLWDLKEGEALDVAD